MRDDFADRVLADAVPARSGFGDSTERPALPEDFAATDSLTSPEESDEQSTWLGDLAGCVFSIVAIGVAIVVLANVVRAFGAFVWARQFRPIAPFLVAWGGSVALTSHWLATSFVGTRPSLGMSGESRRQPGETVSVLPLMWLSGWTPRQPVPRVLRRPWTRRLVPLLVLTACGLVSAGLGSEAFAGFLAGCGAGYLTTTDSLAVEACEHRWRLVHRTLLPIAVAAGLFWRSWWPLDVVAGLLLPIAYAVRQRAVRRWHAIAALRLVGAVSLADREQFAMWPTSETGPHSDRLPHWLPPPETALEQAAAGLRAAFFTLLPLLAAPFAAEQFVRLGEVDLAETIRAATPWLVVIGSIAVVLVRLVKMHDAQPRRCVRQSWREGGVVLGVVHAIGTLAAACVLDDWPREVVLAALAGFAVFSLHRFFPSVREWNAVVGSEAFPYGVPSRTTNDAETTPAAQPKPRKRRPRSPRGSSRAAFSDSQPHVRRREPKTRRWARRRRGWRAVRLILAWVGFLVGVALTGAFEPQPRWAAFGLIASIAGLLLAAKSLAAVAVLRWTTGWSPLKLTTRRWLVRAGWSGDVGDRQPRGPYSLSRWSLLEVAVLAGLAARVPLPPQLQTEPYAAALLPIGLWLLAALAPLSRTLNAWIQLHPGQQALEVLPLVGMSLIMGLSLQTLSLWLAAALLAVPALSLTLLRPRLINAVIRQRVARDLDPTWTETSGLHDQQLCRRLPDPFPRLPFAVRPVPESPVWLRRLVAAFVLATYAVAWSLATGPIALAPVFALALAGGFGSILLAVFREKPSSGCRPPPNRVPPTSWPPRFLFPLPLLIAAAIVTHHFGGPLWPWFAGIGTLSAGLAMLQPRLPKHADLVDRDEPRGRFWTSRRGFAPRSRSASELR